MESSSSSANTAPQPPATKAKTAFFRKFVPVFIITNFVLGVYILLKKKPHQEDVKSIDKVPSTQVASPIVAAPEKDQPTESPALIKVHPPIPEQTQREVLKWILEEKRKIKPQNPSEKKKVDEEKAFLKELIRSKSIPSL